MKRPSEIATTDDPATLQSLGNRLTWARLKRGLSQPIIEAGIREKPRQLVPIAQALQVSPVWLDSGKGKWDATPAEAAPKKGAVFEALTPEELELVDHFRHVLGSDRRAILTDLAKLAEERRAQREELFAEAGMDEIMAKAAYATKTNRASTSVDPADPRLRQRALFEPGK